MRKRLENYAKYRKMDATNYMRYVTDLIGIRGLLLYREDWVNFHKYIIHWFKNDPEKYIRDYGRDYDQNASGYMAEPPKGKLALKNKKAGSCFGGSEKQDPVLMINKDKKRAAASARPLCSIVIIQCTEQEHQVRSEEHLHQHGRSGRSVWKGRG